MMKCSSSVVSLVNDGERLLDMGSLPFSLSQATKEDSSMFLFIFFPSPFWRMKLVQGRKKKTARVYWQRKYWKAKQTTTKQGGSLRIHLFLAM